MNTRVIKRMVIPYECFCDAWKGVCYYSVVSTLVRSFLYAGLTRMEKQ
jgi:hypothetical protein